MNQEEQAWGQDGSWEPGQRSARRQAPQDETGQSASSDPTFHVPDLDSMLAGLRHHPQTEEAVRLPSGGILCVMFRDINFGGPRLAVPSESGKVQSDGSVLIELDAWWSNNLTAIQPGTMNYWKAELIPHVKHLRPRLVKLPMSMTPDGFNDMIGALRLMKSVSR